MSSFRELVATDSCLEKVKIIIEENGLIFNDDEGWTIFHHASWLGKEEVVKYMLEKGIDVNIRIKGEGHEAALHCAAHQGHLNIIKLLIKHKSDINSMSSYQDTPLMYATGNKHLNCVKYLLDCGADSSICNGLKLRAMDIAMIDGDIDGDYPIAKMIRISNSLNILKKPCRIINGICRACKIYRKVIKRPCHNDHIFCERCLLKLFENNHFKCPICQSEIREYRPYKQDELNKIWRIDCTETYFRVKESIKIRRYPKKIKKLFEYKVPNEYRRNGLFISLLKNQDILYQPPATLDDYNTLRLLGRMGRDELNDNDWKIIYQYEEWEEKFIPDCMIYS